MRTHLPRGADFTHHLVLEHSNVYTPLARKMAVRTLVTAASTSLSFALLNLVDFA